MPVLGACMCLVRACARFALSVFALLCKHVFALSLEFVYFLCHLTLVCLSAYRRLYRSPTILTTIPLSCFDVSLRSGARAVAPMCSGPAWCVRVPALWRQCALALRAAFGCPRCGANVLWPCVLRSGARAVAPMCSGPACCVRVPALWRQCALALRAAFGCPRCGANVLWPCVLRSGARAVAPMCSGPACCVRVPALWFGCPRCGANVLWPCVMRSGARAVAPMCSGPACCVRVPALWRQCALALRAAFGARAVAPSGPA